MKHTVSTLALFVAAVAAASVSLSAHGQQPKAAGSAPAAAPAQVADAKGAVEVTTLTAKIESVDLANRMVTVKGPMGRVVALRVDDKVKNLAQVKAGDEIVLKYLEAVSVALVKGGPGRSETQTTTGPVTAPAGAKPGAAIAQTTKIVARVESVDPKTQTVLLQGPNGRYAEVKVRDAAVFDGHQGRRRRRGDVHRGGGRRGRHAEGPVVPVPAPASRRGQHSGCARGCRRTARGWTSGTMPTAAACSRWRAGSTRRRCRWSGRRRGARSPTRRRRRVVVDAAAVEHCDGAGVALFVELLRHPREPAVEVENLRPPTRRCSQQFDPKVLDHDLDPQAPRGPAVEEIGREASEVWRDITRPGELHRRDLRGARARRAATGLGALEGRLAHLRARRRRRAADRRADLVPARDDPRVPVGGADEALRRRDLRRRPDRPRDAARAGAADDGDPARRPLRRRVRRRDRHDARQPGGRRADDDGPRPGALPGHAADHRRGADDAAADDLLRPRRASSAARSRCSRSRSRSRRSSRRSTARST